MIKKNATVGTTENVTTADFGNGTIKVVDFASPLDSEEIYCGIALCNSKKHKVGTEHNTKNMDLDDFKPDVLIKFTSVEGIEILEEYLQKAKEQLTLKMSQNRQIT